MAAVWRADKRRKIKSTAGVLKLASDNLIRLRGMKMTMSARACEIKCHNGSKLQCSCVCVEYWEIQSTPRGKLDDFRVNWCY